MQSYTNTMMNDTTTSTGMTLRSGNTYSKTDSKYGTHTYELDGEDFMPLSSLSEFGWTWAQKVHETLSKTESWTSQTAYEFLGYLDTTSNMWCNTSWTSESDDTFEVGEYLIGLVKWLAEEAASVKNYPNTRSKKTQFGDDLGFCNGIIRLSKEIEMEWNVASHIANQAQVYPEGNEVMTLASEEDDESDSDIEDDKPMTYTIDFSGDIDYNYNEQGGYGHA